MALPEIKVKIGADTSGLERGLAAATANLTQFAKRAGTAVAIAGAGAAAGLIALTKAAIDNADALDNMSQRLGVSVEALSRLQYAAKLSDTSIESLQTGFRTLANNMVAGADAFAQLGISLQNTDGTMRSSVDVFSDVADRFASMENGALKSSIAVDLFGRSGLDLIPMLNAGSAGLAEFARQSDAVGNTLTTNTATAAAQFNDTIDRINLTLGGVVNKIMAAALPALQRLADKIASPEFAAAAANFGVAIVDQLSAIIDWLGKVEERWAQFVDFINTQGRPKVFAVGSTNIENRATPGWMDRNRAAGEVVGSSFDALGGAGTFGSADEMWASMKPTFAPSGFGGGGGAAATSSADAERERIEARLAVIQEGFLTETELMDKKYTDDLQSLNDAFASELLTRQEHQDAVQSLEQQHADKLSAIRAAAEARDLQSMGSFFGAVGSIMEQGGGQMLGIAKAFGAAQALINSYVAASQALADPTVPFWGKAAAFASMVATGLQAVNSIKSATPGGGGGGAGAGAAPAVASSAMNRTLTVQGITAGQIFSGDSMRDFMEQMLQMQRDGYQVVLA
jgi:hypothetical protein